MTTGPLPGSRIGPYHVVGPLGAGGMGEVYRAHDPRLHRDVAIKILPSSFALDEDRLRRFEREARILASLEHRHIAAIYGVEEVDGGKALVLELVEGLTLAERIERGPLDLHETLTIARQIADAVESAHEQGIIHRDLKPANIKVRGDGTVKVLDFGLARADAGSASPEILSAPTITAVATQEGTVMGTAAYMSPEQARGRLVDRRTDIWAFGCILFELLSGHRAFEGDGTSDTLARVLQREPEWRHIPSDTPPRIRGLITRCLQRDQRQRLRDIGDARITIEETLAKPHHDQPAVRPGVSRLAPPAAVIAVTLASAALTYGITRFTSRGTGDANLFDHVVRFVASPAHEFSPVISPDGRWVAYVSNARGPTDVWLKSTSGGDARNLTADLNLDVQANDGIGGLEVSPDGTQLAFVAASPDTSPTLNATYVMSVPLGGSVRRLLDRAQGMRWAPDGKHVVFVRPGGSYGDGILTADADGQNPREIVKREGARHAHWPRWSPDGRFVYFNYGFSTANTEQTEIFRVAAAGGAAPERVVATARRAVFPVPSPDGRGLFYAANPDGVDTNLWWRDLATGRSRRLTFGIGEYTSLSLSADGRRLVAMVSDLRQSLQKVAVEPRGAVTMTPLTEGYTGDLDPSWSPDGTRLVFSSSRSGNRNIWSAKADLSNPTALTDGPWIDERPAFSPDGAQVAFVSDRNGRRGIWVVSADGGSPRLIAPADVLTTVSWSPDGRRLVYAVGGGELPQLETVEVTSGKVTRLPTEVSANAPAWSPVEDVIAYIERIPDAGEFVRFMDGNGRPVSRGPTDNQTILNNGSVSWSPDGKRLAGIGQPGTKASYIWIIDPASATPFRKLMDLPQDTLVRGATWTRDGSSLVIGHVRSTGDIILAERLR